MTHPMRERMARAMERAMFADHELPVDDDLHQRYLETADVVLAEMETPSEGMIHAYQNALKHYIESVPPAERKWRKRKTTGGVESGYRLSPREKMLCRWSAMIRAAREGR
jgi:hypothetical protein